MVSIKIVNVSKMSSAFKTKLLISDFNLLRLLLLLLFRFVEW